MKLVIRQGEIERQVEVLRRVGGYEVRVGECDYSVDAVAVGDGRKSLLIEGAQYEVTVAPREEGAYWVSSGSSSGLVEVFDPLTHLARVSRGGGKAGGKRKVKAYMPGRVVALLAQPGESVAAGQGIVVLEAMKMENEIRADHAGTLLEVFVTPGQAVEGGDLLFEVG